VTLGLKPAAPHTPLGAVFRPPDMIALNDAMLIGPMLFIEPIPSRRSLDFSGSRSGVLEDATKRSAAPCEIIAHGAQGVRSDTRQLSVFIHV